MKTLEEQAREYADKIWGTEDLTDISDFTIPLSTTVSMMQKFARQEIHKALDEAAEKAMVIEIDVHDEIWAKDKEIADLTATHIKLTNPPSSLSKKSINPMRTHIHQKYNGHCAYCGKEITLKQMQVDHIIPLFRNDSEDQVKKWGRTKGAETMDNLNPACARCNRWKSTYTLEQFREEIQKQTERLALRNSGYRMAKDFGLIKEDQTDIKFYYELNP